MDIDPEATVTAADAALAAVDTALTSLVEVLDGGELDRFDANGLVGFMGAFERVRNRMSLVDHPLVSECERREVADLVNLRNTKALLVDRLRISGVDAGRRVRAAAALGQRTSLTGEVRGPERVVMATAQQTGQVSPEQVAIITEAFDDITRVVTDPEVLTMVENDLTRSAITFGPRELRKTAAAMVYVHDQDGKEPDDARLDGLRRFRMGTASDGTVRGSFVLTPEVGASLVAVLSALSKPRPDPPTTDGAPLADAHHDHRTPEQRHHDALGELCARALRSEGLSDSGGVPASVIITINLDDLMRRTGAGETTFGNPISVEQVLRLAGEADVYPTVLTTSGQPLGLGRTRRIATRSQSMALIARDGGCSFPGCDHPPEWCDRHHVRAWIDGGLTDLNNLTLLCRYHHTRFLGKGWTCRINTDQIPEWIPPRWQDPTQTPMIHHRILRRQLQNRIRTWSRPAGSVWLTNPTPGEIPDPFPRTVSEPGCPEQDRIGAVGDAADGNHADWIAWDHGGPDLDHLDGSSPDDLEVLLGDGVSSEADLRDPEAHFYDAVTAGGGWWLCEGPTTGLTAA